MTAASAERHPIIKALIAIAIVVALVMAVSGPGGNEVGAAAPDDERALGVGINDLNDLLCFEPGQKVKTISFSGPGGLDFPAHTSVFATEQHFLGPGVYVRKAWATPWDDTVHIRLNKPATKQGCVAWHTREQSIY